MFLGQWQRLSTLPLPAHQAASMLDWHDEAYQMLR